jgi:hypothetical protein
VDPLIQANIDVIYFKMYCHKKRQNHDIDSGWPVVLDASSGMFEINVLNKIGEDKGINAHLRNMG